MADEQTGFDPTEKILHKEPHDDHFGTWEDRVFICGNGPKKGIGISDGCTMIVRPIKEWLSLDERIADLESRLAKAVGALEKILWAVEVAIGREGTSESKVRIKGIAQEVLAELGEGGK